MLRYYWSKTPQDPFKLQPTYTVTEPRYALKKI